MTNIFNTKVRRLLKDDLIEYAKHFVGFIIFMLIIGLINLMFHLFIGWDIYVPTLDSVNIEGIELDTDFFRNFFTAISFSVISVVMFICGTVSGAELPANVRKGIARIEYFTATITSGVIVAFLIAPLLLIINAINNLIFSSESIFYNAFLLGNSELPLLGAQFLMYIGLFLVGYSIALVWQKWGWIIGLAFGLAIGIFVLGISIFNSNIGGIIGFIVILADTDYWGNTILHLPSGPLAITASILIAIFGAITYILLKNISVKIK